MSPATIPFSILAPGVAAGEPTSPSWRSLAELPLVIIVGVTGVGKSTTLSKLASSGLQYTLLPNRRELTDWLIIPHMQMLDGTPAHPVTDRRQRFEYTRRYRTCFPGGVSHTLTQLHIDLEQVRGTLFFDGLRGAEEVDHALQLLPHARFIVLHTPDAARVRRLLGRNDAFDRIEQRLPDLQLEITDFAGLGVADAGPLFTPAETKALLALVQTGEVNAHDLRAKLQIVVEERRNYDPNAAMELLASQASARTLIIDTTKCNPSQVTEEIWKKLQAWTSAWPALDICRKVS
jgi:hypothetical protein